MIRRLKSWVRNGKWTVKAPKAYLRAHGTVWTTKDGCNETSGAVQEGTVVMRDLDRDIKVILEPARRGGAWGAALEGRRKRSLQNEGSILGGNDPGRVAMGQCWLLGEVSLRLDCAADN